MTGTAVADGYFVFDGFVVFALSFLDSCILEARSLDVDDDGVMHHAVHDGRGDDGIA